MTQIFWASIWRLIMALDPKFPGNPSPSSGQPSPNSQTLDSDLSGAQPGGDDRPEDGKDPSGDDLGFDPESPDVADPGVDPLHPARTDNKIESDADYPIDDDEEPPSGSSL